MPFDTIEVETNPHPVFSLAGLIWWLERQEPTRKYSYWNMSNCLVTQYLNSRGDNLRYAKFGNGWFFQRGRQRAYIANTRPKTFGAALTRARALEQCADQRRGKVTNV